jgi:VanZ family protein
MNRSAARWLSTWGLVVLWVAVILAFGFEGFSFAATARLFAPWVEWALPSASPETRAAIHYFARKVGHAGEYAVLALLALRALRLAHDLTWRSAGLWSLGFVLAVAALDETRQLFTPGRGGAPGDVALDLAGGVLALILVAVLLRRRRRWTAATTPADASQ